MSSVKTVPAYVIYKMGRLLDQSVSMLDPLEFDRYFVTNAFSEAATSTDSHLIRSLEARTTSGISLELIDSLNEVSAMAAARDLNMIASAATRFGVRMHEIPYLEELLLRLSQKTREVPTDTVFGYGTRNPSGERQRSFTKTAEEAHFIGSFSAGMVGLTGALAGLEAVQPMEITNPRFAVLVSDASVHLEEMQRAILGVRKVITPEFFTHYLRPFFDPKTLRGSTYFAAGGAQMPVTLIDLVLWGVEETDRTYIGYRNENMRYLPRAYRSKVEGITALPSILESIIAQIRAGMVAANCRVASASLDSLRRLADQLIKFRAPHLGIAKANMGIRSAGAVGSGGYDVQILEFLLRKTKNFKNQLTCLRREIEGPL